MLEIFSKQQSGGMIVAFGELIQDVIVVPQRPLSYGGGHVDGHIAYYRGGCGPNVAAGCAQMGMPSRFLGHRGTDQTGDRLTQQLRRAGVEVTGVRRGETASSLSVATPDGDTALVFSPGSSRSMRAMDFAVEHLTDAGVLHMNSHHLYSDDTRSAFEHVVQLAKNTGAILTMDVSAANRLGLFGVDRYRSVLQVLQPDVLMANSHEANMLDVFNHYPEGVRLVVVHQGNQPTVAMTPNGIIANVDVTPVANVLDTTGAGDAFAAGFLSALMQGQDITTSIEAAHHLAATTIIHVGVEFANENTSTQREAG